MLLHGMHLARAAGATHVTVPCLGAPGHPKARELFYSVGFRELSRDAPLIKWGRPPARPVAERYRGAPERLG
jgi:hypothetical protein